MGQESVGSVTSMIFTWKKQVFERPALSVAVQVTFVGPRGKRTDPDETDGEHETELIPDCKSVPLKEPL
jgi:hypothetical protein